MKNRKQEVVNKLTAFENGKCKSNEQLKEGFALCNQMGDIAKNLGFEVVRPVRIMELLKWMTLTNAENDYGADNLIDSFVPLCKQFNNDIIQSKLCGREGENKAFKSLQTIKRKHRIIKNVELKTGIHRTEIDLVVVTNSVVFLIEVKNTAKDIIIDEKGNYCRKTYAGDYAFDKNIGEQMNEKEFLLRELLKKSGMEDVEIRSLVVFTNSSMTVTNNYEYITECYLSQLPHIIDNTHGAKILSDVKMAEISQCIYEAKICDEYYVNMDINAFKELFAEIIATMEEAKAKKEKAIKKQNSFKAFFKRLARVACFNLN